jgi:hypothetical protein
MVLSKRAKRIERIVKGIAADTGLTVGEVVRTLDAGPLDTDAERVWNCFNDKLRQAAGQALRVLAEASSAARRASLAPLDDPDLVECIIELARDVAAKQGAPPLEALQTVIAQGAQGPTLVEWRLLALTDLRNGTSARRSLPAPPRSNR